MTLINQPAPDFTLTILKDNKPNSFLLSEHLCVKNIVLLFFPMIFTNNCTKEFCEVSNSMNLYETLDASVYGISGDNPFAQKYWADHHNILIPLLSDYDHQVARRYGVADENFLSKLGFHLQGIAKRSAFIIDNQGIIRYEEIQDDPSILPNFSAIQGILKQLKQ